MDNVKKNLTDIKDEIMSLKDEMYKIAQSKIPGWHFSNVVGSWDCDESPLGLCVYDITHDPAEDNCIYCNEPNERK